MGATENVAVNLNGGVKVDDFVEVNKSSCRCFILILLALVLAHSDPDDAC